MPERRIIDDTFTGTKADSHSIILVLIRPDPVRDHVDVDISIGLVAGNFDVCLGALERCRVIGRHLRNFVEDLVFAVRAQFSLLLGEAAHFRISLVSLLFDCACVIFHDTS